MTVVPIEHGVVEHQVLDTGLSQHRHSARLGRAHDVCALACRHVDDVELAAGRLAPLDGPLDRLGLDEVGTRHRVQSRPVLLHQLRRVRPRDQLVEHSRGLGVHEKHRPILLHLFQRAEHGSVVGLPSLGFIDHELLEGGEAAIDHASDLVLVVVPARDADVEGVVDE